MHFFPQPVSQSASTLDLPGRFVPACLLSNLFINLTDWALLPAASTGNAAIVGLPTSDAAQMPFLHFPGMVNNWLHYHEEDFEKLTSLPRTQFVSTNRFARFQKVEAPTSGTPILLNYLSQN